MEILSALVGAIIGALLTALLANHFSQRERKIQTQIQTTLSLYQQYQSTEMLTSRIKADDTLSRQKLDTKISLSLEELHGKLEQEDWFHISRVLHFFEYVSILHKEKYLDEHLMKSTLGDYFDYWYGHYFRTLRHASLRKGAHDEWDKHFEYLTTVLSIKP
jgi:hypothetical protein